MFLSVSVLFYMFFARKSTNPQSGRGMVVLIRFLYSGSYFYDRGRVTAYAASRAGYETLNTNQQAGQHDLFL
jgi:hypothetical protein